jgi:hypothetical protein
MFYIISIFGSIYDLENAGDEDEEAEDSIVTKIINYLLYEIDLLIS